MCYPQNSILHTFKTQLFNRQTIALILHLFLTSLTSTDEALSDPPRPPSSSNPLPFNEPTTPWESFSRCAWDGFEWAWLWAWPWPECGLQLARLVSLRLSGGLVGMSKSVFFLYSSPPPSLGEGLEYSSWDFHTPSFTCLIKPHKSTQNDEEQIETQSDRVVD